MNNLKCGASVVIEHSDLADMLTEALCGWRPFADLHVTFISEKAGQYHLTLAPKAKAPAAKPEKQS